MSVLVRNRQNEKGTRRRRYAAGLTSVRAGIQAPQVTEQRPAPLVPPVPVAAYRFDDSAPARRRKHGVPQDVAVYNCSCGYVFEASVSTSVGCPHCGDGQAW